MATKKSGGGSEHGDTRWLLSISDFYLQLIILFFMLFAVSQLDKAKAGAIVKGIREKKGITEKNPKVINKFPKKDFLPLLLEKTANLKKGYLKEIHAGTKNIKVSYEILEGGVKLRLEDMQFFDTGESKILTEAESVLKEFVKELSGYYNVIEIIGYTSLFPEDSFNGDHFTLGYQRSKSVFELFKESSKDFIPSQFRLASGGDSNPIIVIPDLIAQRVNQRVEFLISSELIEIK